MAQTPGAGGGGGPRLGGGLKPQVRKRGLQEHEVLGKGLVQYLPVTVPTARTEPLGWKPAERAGSWEGRETELGSGVQLLPSRNQFLGGRRS